MTLLNDISIRNKLLLGFLIVVTLFIFTTMFALYSQSQVNDLNTKIKTQDVVLVERISDLEKTLLGVALQMREVGAGLKFNNEQQVNGALQTMDKYREQIPIVSEMIKSRFEGDASDLEKVLTTSAEYVAAHYEYSKLSINKQSTKELFHKRLLPVRKAMWPLFLPIKKVAHEQLERNAKKIDEVSVYSRNVQLVAVGIAILISSLIAVFIAHNISGALNKIMKTTRYLAEGDFRHISSVKSGDEIGSMSKALNDSIDQLNITIRKVKDTSDSVLNVANVTKDSVCNIRTLSNDQTTNVDTIAVSSEELVSTLADVASELELISQAADELICSAKEEAQRSQNVDHLFKQVELGMLDSTQSISQLAEQSAEIVSILDVIKGIAEQTNLLALNAAIEAARAGEQGRGFAVVADEVRTLAQKTQESTAQIEAMLTDLQTVTGKAVSTINKSDEQVKSGGSLMKDAFEGSQRTQTMIEDVNNRLKGIAHMTSQQASVSRDIGKSIVELSDLSKEVSDFSERAEAETESLFDYNQQLVSLINSFKLK